MVTLTEHAILIIIIKIIKIMMMIILAYLTRVNLSAKLKLFSKGVLDNKKQNYDNIKNP